MTDNKTLDRQQQTKCVISYPSTKMTWKNWQV